MQTTADVRRGRKTVVFFLTLLLINFPLSAQLALIRQGSDSGGTAEPDDWHGWAVALGDFNNDGYDDFAAGAPLEKTASQVFSSGTVVINPGSIYGITWVNAYSLSVIDGSLDPSENHQMGRSLVVGNFNGDAYDDLAVGLPGSTVNGQSAAGRVLVYYGGSNGLSGVADVIHQGLLGAAVETGDLFGWTLGAGRLGDDGYDDLVIGATGENEDRGAVFVIRGGQLGLNLATTQILLGEDLGFANQPGDTFGSAIAVGNIVGFSGGELIVGASGAELSPSASASGMVYIANASDLAVATTGVQRITPLDFGDQLFTNGGFGAALCVGKFWGDTTLDLAIGAPGNHGGGRVYVGRGTSLGMVWNTTLKQNEPPPTHVGVPLYDEPGDQFGASLAAGDHNGDGFDELGVGTPREDFEASATGTDTGTIYIFPGSAAGLSQDDATAYWTIDLGDTDFAESWLGYSLAAGRTSASPRHSFVAGAPRSNGDRGQVFDIAPWRQVNRVLCRSALSADCEGNIIYALRPFDRVKIASTTKIMTVLLASEATKRPGNDPLRVGLQEQYTVEPWIYAGFPLTSSCSIYGFTPIPQNMSESYSFQDLLHACIFPSGNDAAFAIADAMTGEISSWNGITGSAPQFVALMNARAAQIGMGNTLFTNPAGTDPGDPYSTAYDMWLLAKTAMADDLFRSVVSRNNYGLNKILPGNNPGTFVNVPVNLSYGWLNGMQNRDARIIGLKPGSTPGAKSTGVVAAEYDVAGTKLAYATGFGWDNSTYGRDRLAELVQLGLAYCDPDFNTPDGLSVPTPPNGSSPLARGTFNYADATPTALQFASFGNGEPDPQNPETPSDTLAIIDLHAFNRTEVAATAKVVWKYRALWEMAPGSRAGLRIDPVVGGNVRLHVLNEAGDPNPMDASLLLGGTFNPTGSEPVTLAPGVDLYPAAWNNFPIAAGPAEMIIDNDGRETILLSLDATFEVEMTFNGRLGEQVHVQLQPLMASIRSGHVLCRGDAIPGDPFALDLIAEDRQAGAQFVPPLIITGFDRETQPTGRTEQLSMNIAGENWGLPMDAFINEILVESTDTLNSGIWQELERIPVDQATSYPWQSEEPVQQNRFLRVRSAPTSAR